MIYNLIKNIAFQFLGAVGWKMSHANSRVFNQPKQSILLSYRLEPITVEKACTSRSELRNLTLYSAGILLSESIN